MWPALMPSPAELIASFKRRGVRTVLNLHPAYGVQYFDRTYEELAAALGADARTQMPLVGDYANATWVAAFLNITLRPLEALGVDAWWPDWQQNEWSSVMGASPQLLQSYVYASNPFRYGAAAADHAGAGLARSDRPFVLNRWGGWGHHRYPVGFSGDADTSWEMLKFQVYLTATAANVLWSWCEYFRGASPLPPTSSALYPQHRRDRAVPL